MIVIFLLQEPAADSVAGQTALLKSLKYTETPGETSRYYGGVCFVLAAKELRHIYALLSFVGEKNVA